MADTNDSSNREIIIRELQRLPGYKKMGSNGWMMVQCPFHSDNTPSCGIRVAEPALGVFNCLGCEAKGGWNKFAEKTGLEKIKEWNKSESMDENLVNKDLDEQLLGDTGTTFKQVIKYFNVPEATLWPEMIDWRGFPGWFMRKLGAHIINDMHAERHGNVGVGALFPVKVAGRVRGGVKAAFEKKEGSLSYVTSRGSWVQNYGLFPYVYARQLMKRGKINFVVLCEGPRDAMRLCLNGIPAVAVLGSKNVTKRKIMLATAMGADVIYVMPDRDKAGRMMWKLIKEFCAEAEIPAKRIKLPEFVDRHGNPVLDEKGKQMKMDPGNAPRRVIKKLLHYFNQEHDFEIPEKVY